MASVKVELQRKDMRRLTINVRVPLKVSIPMRVGLLLIRLGWRIAGIAGAMERVDVTGRGESGEK